MTVGHPASLRQIEAADPAANTWLSANAGSGKTRVLTDRVARLLLAGVSPQRVLCLTYTRAAAGEMQNRLFARLGAWAMLPEDALRAELRALGEAGPLGAERLAAARRLFARAIETPGGLRIQTIHAFCAALLRRFPLESGTSPRFSEMDERASRLLQEEVLEALAEGAPEVFDRLAAQLGGGEIAPLAAEIAAAAESLERPLDAEAVRARFGLPAGYDATRLLAEVFLGDEAEVIALLLPALRRGSANDQKAADRLATLDLARPDLDTHRALESLLLYGEKARAPFAAKVGAFPTKATRAALGNLLPALDDLMVRLEAARPRRLALAAAERTAALHAFAARFLPDLAARKEARGWLGFDDLIGRARRLLSDPSVAQWVLYKLDGGVDHLLIDEAQDTSPAQWAVVERLTAELTAGDPEPLTAGGAPRRSFFVVGDRKQSIYSFQGADLAAFEAMRSQFATRLRDARVGLNELTLEYSFRSAEAVLRTVDLSLHQAPGLGGEVLHRAFFDALPGRVDLWPPVPRPDAPPDADWWDPVDRLPEEHATARLARLIAAEIRALLDAGTPLLPVREGRPRPLRAGDILILVRRRGPLFHRLIAACKAEGLPMAGADRMKLGAELAVKDLTALLSFLATPEDDLSLAAVLRSPLAGWSEAQLFDLAHPRRGFLWQALRAAATVDAVAEATRAWLADLRDAADYLRPYDLIERALTRHGGRARLLARLGPEAEEGIDALLAQALAYEQAEVPGLTGFLVWLAAGEMEVKRRADEAGDSIRIMTVHGAKGLESPVVILPDSAPRRPPRDRALIRLPCGTPAWRVARPEAPSPLAEALDAADEARDEEDARLLYVAMTRAESWLIVAAAGDADKDCWHARIRAGLEAAGAERHAFPTGEGLRLAAGTWPATTDVPAPSPAAEAPVGPPPAGDGLDDAPVPPAVALPPGPASAGAAVPPSAMVPPADAGGGEVPPAATASDPAGPAPDRAPADAAWALRPPPIPVASSAPLTPTGLGGAKALPGEGARDEAAALRHGRLLHLLLEHLPAWPAGDRAARAADLLAAEADAAPGDGPVGPEGVAALLAEAEAVLAAPDAAPLLAPDALAEVEIAADLAGRRLVGTIDRLILGADRILAVDWKSNAHPPDRPDRTPEGILRQMGAYAHALDQVFPGRAVEVAVFWTRTARLMPLPRALVDAALARGLAELGLPGPRPPAPPPA